MCNIHKKFNKPNENARLLNQNRLGADFMSTAPFILDFIVTKNSDDDFALVVRDRLTKTVIDHTHFDADPYEVEAVAYDVASEFATEHCMVACLN